MLAMQSSVNLINTFQLDNRTVGSKFCHLQQRPATDVQGRRACSSIRRHESWSSANSCSLYRRFSQQRPKRHFMITKRSRELAARAQSPPPAVGAASPAAAPVSSETAHQVSHWAGPESRTGSAGHDDVSVTNGRQQVRPIVIGVAADSGCGKTTFMKRLTSVFGSAHGRDVAVSSVKGANPDSNTLVNSMTTVICLDDYHSLDRKQRQEMGVTALEPQANNFDLMYSHVMALRNGQSILKPIYNHTTGQLDPPELIHPPRILLLEGLHPMYDPRVRDLLDLSIYLDISDEVKFSWKTQRDMTERGHSLESIKKSIAARKPYFDAYIAPQRGHADVVIQVLPTQLIPDDHEGKILRVRMIMKEGSPNFKPVYLFDEGSTITWIPCGRKLTCSYPGIKLAYGPDVYYDNEVSVVEMDGVFDRLDELIYVESNLSNTSTNFYGEITHQMLKNADFPGSNNGTGFFQTIVGLKIREVYERLHAEQASAAITANHMAARV